MIKRCLSYPIGPQRAGMTAGDFLKREGYSHHLIVRLKETPGGLLLNGLPCRTNTPLTEGSLFQVTVSEEESSSISPSPMPFDVVYEDEDLLVVNKEAGVPIHPSLGNHDSTLANGAAWYFASKGEPFVYRAVNRLDRDTTGLLILAKHMLSACLLARQMKEGGIRRQYLALAQGLCPEKGTIDAPIGRAEGSVIARQVDYERGERALTHFQRLSYEPGLDLSLISLYLETGRTHQIRVHMRSIGHPLPGDFLYNPDFTQISRQALHSFRLQFFQPITGQPIDLRAPLPPDMARLAPGWRERTGI